MKKWLCLVLTVCLLLSGVALAEQPAETTATAQKAVALDLNMIPSKGRSVSMEVDNLLTFGMVDEDSVFLTLDGGVLNDVPSATLYWHKDRGLFLRDNKAGTWTELTFGNQKLTLDNIQKMVQSVKELSTWMTSASMPKDMRLIGQALVKVAEDFCNSPEVRMALARLGVSATTIGGISIDNATVNAVLCRLSEAVQDAVNAILAPELLEQLSKETGDAIKANAVSLQKAARDIDWEVKNLELPSFTVELFPGEESLRLRALCEDFQLDISATQEDNYITLDGKLNLSDSPAITISGTVGENVDLLLSSGTELHAHSWEARLLASLSEGRANDARYYLLQASVDYSSKRGAMLDEFQRLNLSYLMQEGRESASHVLTIDSMGENETKSFYADFQSSPNKWSGTMTTYSDAWADGQLGCSLELLDQGCILTVDGNQLTAELSEAEDIQVPVPGEVTNVLDLQQLLTMLN